MQITAELLIEYLEAKKVKLPCEQCGEESWAFVEPPDAETVWALDSRKTNGVVSLGSPGIPCVALCCNNCAFIRLFASIPIQNWHKSTKRDKE